MENPEQPKNTYDLLKESMLSGEISLEDVKNELMEMDQSTQDRIASIENLKFLLNPEVVEFVNSKPEYIDGYKSILSFTEFHVAQILAGEQDISALDYFKNALENAKPESSWAAYIQGTILYMEGKEIPEEIILKAETKNFNEGTPQIQRNMQILRNFNKGLKERGHTSYKEDYSKLD